MVNGLAARHPKEYLSESTALGIPMASLSQQGCTAMVPLARDILRDGFR